MTKVVEGAYGSVEETMMAVHHLINDDGRAPSDIVIVTNSENWQTIRNESPVIVDGIQTDSYRSVWESFKNMFGSKHERTPLEDYGVDKTTAREFNDAIKFGKFVILVEESTGHENERMYLKNKHNHKENKPQSLFDEPKRPLDKKGLSEAGSGMDLTDASEKKSHGQVPPSE